MASSAPHNGNMRIASGVSTSRHVSLWLASSVNRTRQSRAAVLLSLAFTQVTDHGTRLTVTKISLPINFTSPFANNVYLSMPCHANCHLPTNHVHTYTGSTTEEKWRARNDRGKKIERPAGRAVKTDVAANAN